MITHMFYTYLKKLCQSCHAELLDVELVAYIENSPNVLQDSLKIRRVDNQNNKYNRLLCFWHENVSHD